MLSYPSIDPILFQIGPLAIRWYSLSYLAGICIGWWLLRRRAASWTRVEVIDDIIFYIVLGIVIGGRLGSVLFYQSEALWADPLMVLRVWEGGMSFHGGFAGVIVALWWGVRKHQLSFIQLADQVALVTPIGLGLGRLANFINGELWGRPTDAWYGMVFPHVDALARHPSQLYQAFLEGLVLFVALNVYARWRPPAFALSGAFVLGYGCFRFLVEFVREPDRHLSFILSDWVTMGQILSLPMIAAGLAMMVWAYRR